MGKIALWGAAGAIGQSIAAALRAANTPYRVVGRGRAALEAAFGADPLAEIVTWEPQNPASVVAAAQGIETLVYLVGVPYNAFEQHPVVMRQTLDGAIAAGVRQVLLVGTVYPYGRPSTTPVREDHPRQPHTYKGKMRLAQEDMLMEADARGQLQATVLRLPDFYGPGVTLGFLHSAFVAAATGGRAQLLGPIDTPHEFVYVPDVGPVIVRMLAEPRVFGRIWHLSGSGVTTVQALVAQIFAAVGKKPKMLVAGRNMVRFMGIFSPLMRELVEMHYLLTTPVLLDDTALTTLLPGLHKTAYEAGLGASLAWAQQHCGSAAHAVSPSKL